MMRQQVGKFDGKYKQELNHVVLGSCDWAFGFVLKRLGHHARVKQENKGKSLVAKKVKHRGNRWTARGTRNNDNNEKSSGDVMRQITLAAEKSMQSPCELTLVEESGMPDIFMSVACMKSLKHRVVCFAFHAATILLCYHQELLEIPWCMLSSDVTVNLKTER